MIGKNGRPGLDLWARIALVAVAVFVSFVTALTFFSIHYFEDTYEKGLGRHQFMLASRVADDLERRIGFARETLGHVAQSIGPSLLSDPAAGQKFLDERITLHVFFDERLRLLSKDGRLVAQSPGGAERGADLSSDEVFRALSRTGGPVISGPYRSSRTGRPSVTFGVPIRDGAGRVIGQLHGSAALDGPNLLGDLGSVPIGKGGYFVLVDSARTRLVHPDPALRLGKVPRGVNPGADAALDGRFEGVIDSVNSRGVRMLTAARRLDSAAWVLFANAPTTEIRGHFTAALPLYAGAVAAGALVLVLALWYMLRRLTAPLEETIAAVARIASGPAPGQRVGAHGVGEVARLGATFDALLDVVESRERELRAGEERFRALFQQSPLMMALAEPDGTVIDANGAFLEAAKCRRDEVIGRTGEDLGLVPRGERIARMAALAAGDAVPAKERTVLLGGAERHVRSSFRTVRVEERTVVLVVLEDVTEQRRAEAERRGLEEQLQQQQRLESLGVLAGGIAHDFNNLLTPIIANASLGMEELPADHPVRADMEQILEAACRGAELTKRILAFGRRQVLERKVVDLNVEVRSIEKLLRRVIGEDIDLMVECADEPVPVDADETQLHQMLVNLAVNAREAMPKGGKLAVSVSAGAPARPAVAGPNGHPGTREALITVSDTGCGIDAAVLPRIFEPFFTTKPKDKGTGLGLSTVHGIVEQHGGRISVESAPGKGTTFWIVLPVADRPVLKSRVPAAVTAGGGRKLRIVLVEDEPLVRTLAERILRNDGHEVVAAGSPAAALSLPDELRPDLLVSDVILPGIDGVELYRRLRGRWPDLSVLFMSGFPAGHPEIDEAIAGKHFIQKPFGPTDLLARVRQAVAMPAPTSASSPADPTCGGPALSVAARPSRRAGP